MAEEKEIKAGDRWESRMKTYKVKVLANADGWIMAVRKGDHPFVETVRVFSKKFRYFDTPKPTTT